MENDLFYLCWMPLITVFVIMWSIAVAVFLVTRVGLFIVGIILYWNMLLKKCWTFLLDSWSKRLIFKSPAKTFFFSMLYHLRKPIFRKLFKYCHITVWRPIRYTKIFYRFCGAFQYRVTQYHLNLWIYLYLP